MLETGYVMLQIRLLIQALTKLLTGQTGEQMDSTLIEVEAVGKSMDLMDLAVQGRINEVENRFFAALEQSPKDAILLKEGLDFYGWLNDKEESWLQLFDFSHEEIRAGIRDLAVLMGQSVMADLVLDE
ncbi:MAG: DUF6483 family protein [Clostridiales bacterium]|nr:DUF6483 family protein [Clostridiales bacterium]